MMKLVDYADSDSDDDLGERLSDNQPDSRLKQVSQLPLPNSIKGDAEDQKIVEQDTHNGKIRSFEHERGNWASYVSVPVPHVEDFDDLSSELMDILSSTCSYKHPFHKIDNPHISLTRTLKLRHHWLPELNQSLEDMCRIYQSFYVSLRDVDVYTNDEETRTFISVKVVSGDEQLLAMVKNLNKLLSLYNLPPFYQEASFHVSLCWCLLDAKLQITAQVRDKLQSCVDDWIQDNPECSFFKVSHLVWKAGNKESLLALSDR